MKSKVQANLLVCGVLSLALVACKSKPEEKADPVPIEEKVEAREEPTEEVVEKEPEYCEEGAEEYSRQQYRWCMRDGVIDGNFTAYDENGKVQMTGTFVQGTLQGTWTDYYPDGNRRWSVDFVDGKEDGQVLGWYPDGTEHYKIPFVAGERQGDAIFYYPSSARAAMLHYEEGKPAGTWTYWYANGQKAHEYAPDKKGKAGIHQHWHEDGKTKKPVVGQLAKSKIYPVVEPLGELVVKCYQHARIFDKSSGKIVAQMTIGYGGEVSNISIFESDFDHPFMTACTRRHIESLTFPDNPYGPKTLIRSWELSVE
jgi:antitoxin component YwqK of YwqJK toxin-antitoxin module